MTADKINLAELRAQIDSYLKHGNRRNALPIDADELLALIDAVEAARQLIHRSTAIAYTANFQLAGDRVDYDRATEALDRFTP